MSNLISGKEAKLAWANNKEIEYMPLNKWNLLGGSTPLSIFDRDDVKFRIKPRTITINGIEVPAPFEPKEGENIFTPANFLEQGYIECKYPTFENHVFQFGAWRTDKEIKQVGEALLSIFK